MSKERHEYLLTPDGASRSYQMDRYWETQPKPYKRPLGYSYSRAYNSGSYSNGFGDTHYYDIYSVNVGGSTGQTDLTIDAINKCYGKFISKMSDSQSQWVNNVIEAKDSIDMIASRATQIAKFAHSLRKGRFKQAAKALSTPSRPVKQIHLKSKDFGGQFLEYHFGWEPLLEDMHSAVRTLRQDEFNLDEVKVSVTLNDIANINVRDPSGDYLLVSHVDQRNTFRCKMGALFKVINPNAYKSNQLGLINPASIAWEAVPFSFVADWFGNIGQVLSSMTDFVGVEIQNAYTTTSTEIVQNYNETQVSYRNPMLDGSGRSSGKLFKVSRQQGIAGPAVSLRPFQGFSLTRGVTAISLALQFLK
ncbi:TPA_asm: maturation protein [ssRNA phage Esthiorhiza.2_49]|uniref:Maturation protein n=2 Tax=Fiersviridae TaxID=2842319 RepID=A0A8S5L2D2_9VIRU|nr:maturation protein [ssRNA phage Esthiorhiza.2_49]QDH86672.1 MAG: hypothetical protein H2RhizoLitter7429_000003 [Leviviridae sp.]DAD51567.1 TPA_asm: maturation protein [ssRNA phage Esthiorhiza.2_49]